MTDEQHHGVTVAMCKQWWEFAAEALMKIEADAGIYMPENLGAVDNETAAEILDTLTSAKVSADSAFGAFYRVAKQQAAQQQRAAAPGYPQPQYTNG